MYTVFLGADVGFAVGADVGAAVGVGLGVGLGVTFTSGTFTEGVTVTITCASPATAVSPPNSMPERR
jgi:hypothetical protein